MASRLEEARAIFQATRKKNDQLFNQHFMRPIAAFVITFLQHTRVTPNQLTLLSLVLFVAASTLLITLDTTVGGVIAVLGVEASYLFDCADGMLARHKKLASKEGHLFDFFTDELKATLLTGALGLRLYRTGGLAPDLRAHGPLDPLFLIAGMVAITAVASAISLTNFVRRPELSGRETSVEAFYETASKPTANRSAARRAVDAVTTFLRFVNHYPSHLWLFAAAGRLDVFFWLYALNNLAYLGRGWLGLFVRFGRG